MSGRFHFARYDKDAPGAAVDAVLALELRRLANLFLVSAITLALFILRAFAETVPASFIPQGVHVVWAIVLLTGWAATLVYGAFVTFTARRWGWFVLCLLPLTCVPAAAAYAWIRRGEVERDVLGDRPAAASHQRRGGRDRR